MKIIISHDVDHLYSIDHWLHDLIIEKLWIRSFIHMLQGKIKISTFVSRLFHPFHQRYCRIEELLDKDMSCGIPSTFYFGMGRGLGMSYGAKKAVKYIQYVMGRGFDVGVHGVSYKEFEKMKGEHDSMANILKRNNFGIRMHYVRYDENTFDKLATIDYLYDTSLFDKKGEVFEKPFKVKKMWEIPLYIMDGYIIPIGDLETAKLNTIRIIETVKSLGVPYCTILFHDYLYNEKCYPDEKAWYDWLLIYLKEKNYQYISYQDAVKELEEEIHEDSGVCE